MNKIKVGDTVQVMRGKDAGKKGEVLKIVKTKNKKGDSVMKVVVKGVNIVKRAQKPNPQFGIPGGIIEIEKPIDISNVMYFDESVNSPTRIGFKIDEKTGKKFRISKKSGKVLDK
ncbi:MAG: 50S ribosomal protein L24 [Candidatus Dojkabacteria bacterium]|nr:MAG: 50S ribosomal protein L24 [Candidatus Dojkabacteria bacterium]